MARTRIASTNIPQPIANRLTRAGQPFDYRRISVWVESMYGGLSGSVDWYENGERVESVVVGAGPFSTAQELWEELLQCQRRHQPLPTNPNR